MDLLLYNRLKWIPSLTKVTYLTGHFHKIMQLTFLGWYFPALFVKSVLYSILLPACLTTVTQVVTSAQFCFL